MKGIAAYQDNAITTQGQGRLIVMLYEGAIKFMKLAIREIEAENWEAKHNYLIKAQEIIVELNAVLDMDAGGEVAQNLRKLYMYMGRRLTEANIQKDPEIIREVISLAEELNAGWKAIAN